MKLTGLVIALVSLALGVGAVELPVLNWNPGSDWVNVKEKGAKGDGKTDDTAALRAVFAALEDGMTIYFPPGTYVIKDELKILKTKIKHNEKRYHGNSIYGHGRDTVLLWDGPENGSMIRDMGMLHCRVMGFTLEGNNRAAYGIHHDNDNKFETHLYNEYLAFRNFRKCGFMLENNKIDGLSTAETLVRHSIFENCNIGSSFTSFNDYNFTFDGCYFIGNKIGVECVNGNFYVRNSFFGKNEVDVFANPEHASSIRRSVSVGSGVFLEFANGVSPFTVENCLVADWTGKAAIQSRGAPMTVFDNVFEHSSAAAMPFAAQFGQKLLLANNTLKGPAALTPKNVTAVNIPLEGAALPLTRTPAFMPKEADLPGKLFDAIRDFGAKADGKTDDTAALEKTIAAARAYGKNAIAYLPFGTYKITKTLVLDGKDYFFGGSGNQTIVLFAGAPEHDAIQVRPAGNLRLDNLAVRRHGMGYKDRDVVWSTSVPTGADIHQFPSAAGSRVTYHTVYVAGKYSHIPFTLGMLFQDLAKHDTVILDNIEGNIRLQNAGAGTIYAPVSYEGTVSSKGAARGGIFAILTRLATLSEYSLCIEDNNSMIATDFYIEQAQPSTIILKGSPALPAGRVTLSLPKLDITRSDAGKVNDLLVMDNYQGELNLIATQFYPPKWPARISVTGEGASLNLLGNFFYVKSFELAPADMKIGLLQSSGNSEFNQTALKLPGADASAARAVNALQDLRAAGLLDWTLAYPQLLKK